MTADIQLGNGNTQIIVYGGGFQAEPTNLKELFELFDKEAQQVIAVAVAATLIMSLCYTLSRSETKFEQPSDRIAFTKAIDLLDSLYRRFGIHHNFTSVEQATIELERIENSIISRMEVLLPRLNHDACVEVLEHFDHVFEMSTRFLRQGEQLTQMIEHTLANIDARLNELLG